MRLTLRMAALAAGLLACLFLHFLFRAVRARSPWPLLFLRWAGYCAGLRVSVEGHPLTERVLFVSNHVTWLDILVLGGRTGAAFVSRDDVEHWPVVGRLAAINDTLYVERRVGRGVTGQADRLRRALSQGRTVALFPEGTTEGGDRVLAFRPSLFASLFPPVPGVRVQPVAIDYGEAAREIAWVGAEPAGHNARRVLSRPGRIPVRLFFLPPIDPGACGDRKALAAAARQAVVEQLGAFEPPPDPLYGRDEEPESAKLSGQVVRLPDERL